MFATQKQRRVGELLWWITTASLAKNLKVSKDTAEWIILGINNSNNKNSIKQAVSALSLRYATQILFWIKVSQ